MLMRLLGIDLLLVLLVLLLLLLLQLSCNADIFFDGRFWADTKGKLNVCRASDWLFRFGAHC